MKKKYLLTLRVITIAYKIIQNQSILRAKGKILKFYAFLLITFFSI